MSIVNEGREDRSKKQIIFTSSKHLFKRDITWSSYFIFLKEYTFEHDGIQYEFTNLCLQ